MKLELGEIKMDSESGVQIGTTECSGRRIIVQVVDPQPVPQTMSHPNQIWPAAMIVPVLATAVFAVLAVLLFLSGQPIWLVAFLYFTLQIPATAFFLSARSRAAAVQQAHTALESFTKDQMRLREFLAKPQGSQTISQICRQLALPENRAVELVHSLLTSQQVEEDVDLETGHFVYRTAEKIQIDPDHKSAAERIEKTQKQQKVTKELR